MPEIRLGLSLRRDQRLSSLRGLLPVPEVPDPRGASDQASCHTGLVGKCPRPLIRHLSTVLAHPGGTHHSLGRQRLPANASATKPTSRCCAANPAPAASKAAITPPTASTGSSPASSRRAEL